jgi:phosphatidylglycerophosphate synthase
MSRTPATQHTRHGDGTAPFFSPPNLLSLFRIAAAPLQLALAWWGEKAVFVSVLVVVMITDAVDGFLARHVFSPSRLGARLDSWGDFATYLSLPACIWWLWPDLVIQEWPFVVVALACYVIPTAIGFLRFGRMTCYHTLAAKTSAIVIAPTVLLMLLGGPHWPFRASMPLLIYAAIEDSAISLVLKHWRPNVPTVLHAWKDPHS